MSKKFLITAMIAGLAFSCSQAPDESPKASVSKANVSQSAKTNTAPVNTNVEIDKSKTVAATVNGSPIYKEDLRGNKLDKAINEEILFQHGVNLGLDKKVEQRVNDFRKSLVISQIKIDAINEYMALNPVTAEEIEERYSQLKKNRFLFLKLQEMEIADENTANDIHSKVAGGADFSKAASANPKATVKEMDRLTKRFNQFFTEMKVGEVSKVVENNGKYYIYRISEVQSMPETDAKRRINLEKKAEKKRQAIARLIQKLKTKEGYKIEIIK